MNLLKLIRSISMLLVRLNSFRIWFNFSIQRVDKGPRSFSLSFKTSTAFASLVIGSSFGWGGSFSATYDLLVEPDRLVEAILHDHPDLALRDPTHERRYDPADEP